MGEVDEIDESGQFHLRSLFVTLNNFHHARVRAVVRDHEQQSGCANDDFQFCRLTSVKTWSSSRNGCTVS
jgi:hypothetical protein